MPKELDLKTLRAALHGLGIKVPYYSTTKLSNGTIEITTRNGVQKWKPPTAKRKPASKRKARVKAKDQNV